MYVIGTKYNGRPNALMANSVIQISSSDPEKVLIALTKDTHSCTAIRENGIFTISVLSTDTPASVISALGLVSGKNADKLKNIRHKVLIEGVPVVKENTCCWFLCKVISSMDVGQEMVFAAEIIAGSDSAIGTPMTYDFYRSEMHGLSPVGSLTYAPPESTFDKSSGESFVCSVRLCTATRTSALKNCGQLGVPGLQNAEKARSCAEIKQLFPATNERIFRQTASRAIGTKRPCRKILRFTFWSFPHGTQTVKIN